MEPPGGTFRTEVLQGFSFLSEEELTAVIKDVSSTTSPLNRWLTFSIGL